MIIIAILIALLVATATSCSGKGIPIVCIHGFNGSASDFDTLSALVDATDSPSRVFPLTSCSGMQSTQPVFAQTALFSRELDGLIRARPQDFSQGFHLVGHSLGALVARALLQSGRYRVRSFVSLAGVQNGLYGHCDVYGGGRNASCAAVTAAMYTHARQTTSAAANFWRDPHRARYLSGNEYLPVLNNEAGSSIDTNQTHYFTLADSLSFFASPKGLFFIIFIPHAQHHLHFSFFFSLQTKDYRRGRRPCSSSTATGARTESTRWKRSRCTRGTRLDCTARVRRASCISTLLRAWPTTSGCGTPRCCARGFFPCSPPTTGRRRASCGACRRSRRARGPLGRPRCS